MDTVKPSLRDRVKRWIEPELFRPFLFGVLFSLTLVEFARGALTLSLLPTYGRTVLNFAVEWTALALSVHYLVDNLLRPVAGWLADKIGQRLLLLSGFLISSVALLWMMQTHSLRGLLLSAALYGLGVTPVWPSAVSGIGLATPPSKRASFMGYLYIFWLLGTGLGPVLINFVIGRTYRVAFWLLVAVNVLGFVLAWRLVRKPVGAGAAAGLGVAAGATAQTFGPAEAGVGAGAETPVGLRAGVEAHGAGAAGAHGRLEEQPLAARMSVIKDRAYWRDMWRNIREMSFLFPGMFIQTFAVSSLIPILSLFARIKLNLSGAMYSAILVSGGICTVLLLIPSGRLVDRFGPRRFLVPGFLVAGTALALYPLRHTLVNTFLFVIVLGVSYAFILPAWNWVLDHSIDPDKKGALWGVFMTVEGAGAVVGPYVGGLLWDRVGSFAPFWLSAAVILVMGLLYMVLPIEKHRNTRGGGISGGITIAMAHPEERDRQRKLRNPSDKFKRRGESP